MFYPRLLCALGSSLFLLLINLVTKGRGMGLGDVKLALPLGLVLGFPLTPIWLFLSFLTGAIGGSILILVGKARLKDKIAFGPFLILSFYLTLFFGNLVIDWLGRYWY